MAIFKIKLKLDYNEENNFLKKDMEVEVYTRNQSATVYGGVEIKMAIEKKYSIIVNGIAWNNKEYLEIEKSNEKCIENLLKEQKYIVRLKILYANAHLFDECAHLRDWEMEVISKINKV